MLISSVVEQPKEDLSRGVEERERIEAARQSCWRAPTTTSQIPSEKEPRERPSLRPRLE